MHHRLAILCLPVILLWGGCAGNRSSRETLPASPPVMVESEEDGRVAQSVPMMTLQPVVANLQSHWSESATDRSSAARNVPPRVKSSTASVSDPSRAIRSVAAPRGTLGRRSEARVASFDNRFALNPEEPNSPKSGWMLPGVSEPGLSVTGLSAHGVFDSQIPASEDGPPVFEDGPSGQRIEAGLLETSNFVVADTTRSVGEDVSQPSSPTSESALVNINLPTALSLIGPQHPAVGFARWRVQQAYAELSQAKVLWLPSLRGGFGFHRHDGNYQASNGEIVDVNRNSFQYGLGVGAVGAGTTTFPGVIAEFHLADAIFQPKIAGSTLAARSSESRAVLHQQMMEAAVAYLELLGTHQGVRILEEIRDRAAELSKLTSDFAATGAGLQADADRMETELALIETRLLAARERCQVAGARLARTLGADPQCEWIPTDSLALPLDVVSLDSGRSAMIQIGLFNRPELREAQSLVAAACERYRREKFSPFVPSVLLGFSNGGFGGGLGNTLNQVDGRYDFDALVAWEIRNLGFGERAARRATSAQVQQAKFEKIRRMDQVACEISEAYSQANFRSKQVSVAQRAIEQAMNSYDRNLRRIRDGQGLPLESLQSLEALREAQQVYLRSVVEYNQAQFRLQWAMGWPVTAPQSVPENVPENVPQAVAEESI